MEIIITNEQIEDRYKTITGEFTQFKGWTFDINLHSEPQNSDCWACSCDFISDVALFHNGELYYSSPGFEYDNIAVYLGADHHTMFELIDSQFRG